MDKINSNLKNNTDFQPIIEGNQQQNQLSSEEAVTENLNITSNNDSVMASGESDKNSIDVIASNVEENSNITNQTNITAEENINIQNQYNSIDKENVNQEVSTCKLDKKKDEKLKNLYFVCIPFILTAIILSLFNMGRVRYPLSFLFLALGLLSLSISSLIRSKIISKTCDCKDCTHQSRNTLKFAFFYGFAGLGLIGVFIFYLVTGTTPSI